MTKNLYVGNLSHTITDADLESVFDQYGRVRRAQIAMDRDTGRSRGFAFVEMGTEQEAQNAIAQLNEQQFGGRRLTVNEARPQVPRGGGGFGGGRNDRSGGGGPRRRSEPRW